MGIKKYSEGKPYKVVAFCLACFQEFDQVNLINRLCERCKQNNVKFMFFTTVSDFYLGTKNDNGEKEIFSLFDAARYDAIVIMSETFKKFDVALSIAQKGIEAGVPVISVDAKIKGCINIVLDYGIAFEQIVRHIVEDHHLTRINFIAGQKGNPFSDERLEVYKKVLSENNIEYDPARVGYGDFWSIPARDVTESIIKSDLPFPEAIICANDTMAIEACQTLKQHGYRIPEDVIVTGFDGIDMEQYLSPRLTTAEYNTDELVNTIYRCIADIYEGKEITKSQHIHHKFRIGESCGCNKVKLIDVSQRLLDEKLLDDEKTTFIQTMYNMVLDLSNCQNLSQVFGMVSDYLINSYCKEYWLCLNTNFLNKSMNVSTEFSDSFVKNYTDEVRIPLHVRNDKMLSPESIQTRELVPNLDNILEKEGYIMFVPMHLQGTTIGYMANTFDLDRFRFVFFQSFLLNFRHILEIYKNRTDQEKLYVTDVLTKTYNRLGFYSYIEDIINNCMKEGLPLSIISLDMDGLKKINDTYGHLEGDFAISKLASCIRESINSDEICTRFGGDEFLIAFCSSNNDDRANEIVDNIKRLLDEFNSTGEKRYSLVASFGIYSKVPDSQASLDDYIRFADNLMYKDKKEHKDQRK